MPLTPRLERIVTLVAEGYLNKQIAHQLGTTEGTVKQYVQEARRALKLPGDHSRSTRVLLTRWALRR